MLYGSQILLPASVLSMVHPGSGITVNQSLWSQHFPEVRYYNTYYDKVGLIRIINNALIFNEISVRKFEVKKWTASLQFLIHPIADILVNESSCW